MCWTKLVKAFGRDERGVLAPLFAISLIPMVTLVGITVDYSRANSGRTGVQAAIDAAALMLSKEAVGLEAGEIQRRGQEYVRSLLPDTQVRNLAVTTTMTQALAQYRIDMRATGYVAAEFGNLIGRQQIDIASTTQVTWGRKRLELALVLDNTGSMGSSGKLAALKSATHNLINTLQSSARRPEDVRVSIIPFDTVVNVGTGSNYAGQSWFDMNGTVNTGTGSNRFWGCVMDRTSPYDTRDTNPTTSFDARFMAAPAVRQSGRTIWQSNCNNGLATILPLTNDWTAMRTKVDQMRASGNTNITVGVAWGMHALTPSLPMTEAEPMSTIDLEKYMIVLTDGDNTESRTSTTRSTIDARTQAACAEAKAMGIRIYTVRVINGNANLLRGCASVPAMYYDVQNVSSLTGVFGQIAGALSQIYISR
jgi:Flp pilus assembly protein TadG